MQTAFSIVPDDPPQPKKAAIKKPKISRNSQKTLPKPQTVKPVV